MLYAIHQIGVASCFLLWNLPRLEHVVSKQHRWCHGVFKTAETVVKREDCERSILVDNGNRFEIVMVVLY